MYETNLTVPTGTERTSIMTGLALVIFVLPIIWWPEVANLWLPEDFVLRNLAAQGMDWVFVIILLFLVFVLERAGFQSLGFKRLDSETLAAGLGLGGFFMVAMIGLRFLWPHLGIETATADSAPNQVSAPPYFFLWFAPLALITAAVAEEIIFRGYGLERMLRLKINPVVAVIIIQFVFAAYHVKDGMFSVVNAALVGSLFSMYYARYRNLTMTIIGHGLVDSLAVVGRLVGIA